MERGSD